MITRFEVATRPDLPDALGEATARTIREHLGLPVARVRTRAIYHVEGELNDDEARRVLAELVDPVLQRGAIGRIEGEPFDVAIAVGFKPGVTDPVATSARVAIEDTLGRPLGDGAGVYTSRLYLLDGLDEAKAAAAAERVLANPVIERIRVAPRESWIGAGPNMEVPRVEIAHEPRAQAIDLDLDDEGLMRVSREGLLALSLEEMQAIRDEFRRAADDPGRRAVGLGGSPTDVELECLAQTWSEHCSHKIFNATIRYREHGGAIETIDSLFGRYIRGATKAIDEAHREREGCSWLVSVFHDNAGVVAFDESRHLVFKVETHNSPSALDPYGGAITGIVGVNRDPFGTGLGANLLVNVWGYCFGPPDHDGELPRGLLHPRRIRHGVHAGVIDGGNQSGIPYGRGWELFDERFIGKPLVFCGTVGALPVTIAGGPGEKKGARPGDRIVMTGGRIGADGIHGATFSSAALDEDSPVQAVQIGDPITQKLMFDFLLDARERGLYSAITDNGAGGLSSSVGEMAEASGGARMDLALAPLKYQGLSPWEVLVSEAQERMTLAVPPERVDELLALAARRDVEATVLGEFTDDGLFHLTWGETTVGRLPMSFLHDGAPELILDAHWDPPRFDEPPASAAAALDDALTGVLGALNCASNEAVARHYDHEVKALSVVRPFVGVGCDVPAEATVFLAAHDSLRGFVLSEGVNPFYSDIDTHAMAGAVVDLAVRRQLCGGAGLERIAVLDNFCWPDPVTAPGTPDGAHKLAQLVRACRGLDETVRAYETPLISGKDSMKNDSTRGGVKVSVPPTLLVSAIGQIDDVRGAITLDPKQPGERIYVLGTTRDELGGSEYWRWLGRRDGARAALGDPQPYVGNAVPRLDTDETLPLYRALARATAERLVRAAAATAIGGLATTLARMAIAGRCGLEVDLDRVDDLRALSAEAALFSESVGRVVVTVAEADAVRFEAIFDGLACRSIGTVDDGDTLRVHHGGRAIATPSLGDLLLAFTTRFGDG